MAPSDGGKLRYWDGAAWTEHVTAKQQEPPPPTMPVYPGAVEVQQTWQYGQPPGQPPVQQQQPQQQPWPQQPQQPQQQPWPQQPPWPQQQPWPQPPFPPPGGVTTPDGARVTSWVKRLGARLLDGIFVGIGTLPLTGYFLYRTAQTVFDQMNNGTYHSFSPSGTAVAWESAALGIILVADIVYEVFSLRRWGATPGKRLVGISVRRWDQGGQLPWSTIARRVGFIYALSALSLVPLVGILASIAALVNYLFPLWDKRRQALHDKVANTVVIEGGRAEVTDPGERHW
jgi:uncharacterized RDD family membrane protein YckC